MLLWLFCCHFRLIYCSAYIRCILGVVWLWLTHFRLRWMIHKCCCVHANGNDMQKLSSRRRVILAPLRQQPLARCWSDVVPASATVEQHQVSIGSAGVLSSCALISTRGLQGPWTSEVECTRLINFKRQGDPRVLTGLLRVYLQIVNYDRGPLVLFRGVIFRKPPLVHWGCLDLTGRRYSWFEETKCFFPVHS